MNLKRNLILLSSFVLLTGCSTIKEYWPRDHDGAMFKQLVVVQSDIDAVNCDKPDWSKAIDNSKILSLYTEWREDPQRINMKGLYEHTVKMSKSENKVFCELGKKTASGRIDAARKAWGGR